MLDSIWSEVGSSFSAPKLWRALLLFGSASLMAALCVFLFFPGYHDGDTAWQYQQAYVGPLNGWHPPAMSVLWGWLMSISGGDWGLLIFNCLAQWTGLALIADRLFKRNWTALVFLLSMGFTPYTFPFLSQYWKDSHFTAVMILSLGFLLCYRRGEGPWERRLSFLLSLLFFCYAVNVRHNSIFAILPLCMMYAWPLQVATWQKVLRLRVAVTFALTCGLVLTSTFVTTRVLLKPEQRAWPEQMLFQFDTSAISVLANKNYLPDFYVRGTQSQIPENYRSFYHPHTGWGNFWGKDCPGFVWSDEELAQLKNAWLHAVSEQPRVYLSHRYHYFLGLIGFHAWYSGFGTGFVGEDYRPYNRSWDLTDWKEAIRFGVMQNLSRLGLTVFFRPYWIMLYAGVLLLLSLARVIRFSFEGMVLQLSAWCYLLAYFFVGVGWEIRYAQWFAVSAFMLIGFCRWNLPIFRARRPEIDQPPQRHEDVRPADSVMGA